MRLICTALLAMVGMLFFFPRAWAHTPFMACFDNGDATITCNGEFSDGASAAGTAMQVVDASGNILSQGRMDEDGEYTFAKPASAFTVIFDAGPGHVVREESATIVK